MNIGSWPARRIFWLVLLWELALTAVLVVPVASEFVSVASTGSGGVGASGDSRPLLRMLLLIIVPPPVLIGVWVRQGKHGFVKGLKILFSIVLSFVFAVLVFAAVFVAWIFRHGGSIGYGFERTH